MSPHLRVALEADAIEAGKPIQNIMRGILCEHYDLDCSPIYGNIRKDAWKSAATMRLKMQPELFQALKEDAAETGESMRSLVMEALEAHYGLREVAA